MSIDSLPPHRPMHSSISRPGCLKVTLRRLVPLIVVSGSLLVLSACGGSTSGSTESETRSGLVADTGLGTTGESPARADGGGRGAGKAGSVAVGFMQVLPLADASGKPGVQPGQLAVRVAVDALLAMQPGDEVSLTLPTGKTHVVGMDRLETNQHNDGKVWLGHLKNEGKAYYVNLSVHGDSVVGELLTPGGNYRLFGSRDRAVLEPLDVAKRILNRLFEDDAVVPPEPKIPEELKKKGIDGKRGSAPGAAATKDGLLPSKRVLPTTGPAVLNVLALTTTGYASTWGASTQTCINMAVASANQAFADSQIQLSLNLVHVEPVPELSDALTSLEAVNAMTYWTSSLPVGERIQDVRVQRDADVVVLFKNSPPGGDGSGGRGWLGGYRATEDTPLNDMEFQSHIAFSVNQSGCDSNGITLAHEVGHNLGSQHTRAMEGSSPVRGAFNASYGHSGMGTGGQSFSTLMGYGPWVRAFSNPNLTTFCYGAPCGIASGPAAADNATGFNAIRHKAAGWSDFNTKLTIRKVHPTGGGVGYVNFASAEGGGGYCADDPAGCFDYFLRDSVVTLTAYDGNGALFTGWSGACTGTQQTCAVTLDAAKSVTANYVSGVLLSVDRTGANGGFVYASDVNGYIYCGLGADGLLRTTCASNYRPGSTVTLTAYNTNGAFFTGWSGACTGAATTCTVTMDAAKTVTANFVQGNTLTVVHQGISGGYVSGIGVYCGYSSAGIAQTDCSESLLPGSTVTLTAYNTNGAVFAGWSGACTGSATTCTVTMSAAQTVTANFVAAARLTLTRVGSVSGGFVSGGGLACGFYSGGAPATGCASDLMPGSQVTLTAYATNGGYFVRWGGACAGVTTTTCNVTMDNAKTVTAEFAASVYLLSVSKAGNGAGTVTGGDINCGSTCTTQQAGGSSVVLTATPSAISTFTGWSGACTGTGTCTVAMNAHRSVTANFALKTYALTVIKAGAGSGTVSGGAIACGSTCSAQVNHGTSVTLTATPATGSSFSGWSGACTGTGTCTVSMTEARSVAVLFTQIPQTLTVTRDGNGTGSVAGGTIACGSTCTATLPYGSSVSLTATPVTGSSFAGWSGACTGTSTTCSFALNGNLSTNARFTLNTYLLTVTKAGAGSGTVSGGGITACGSTCQNTLNHGTAVTLTATPGQYARFAGWSGACTGTGTCTVSMTAARSVTATFEPVSFLLTVSRTGGGQGAVTAANLNCGSACSASYNGGSSVTLTATPQPGSRLISWGGACAGAEPMCVVSMTAALNVTAHFALTPADGIQVRGTGDFNGDGKDDVVWHHPVNGLVYLSFMNGAAITDWVGLGSHSDTIMGTGDFNGDGKADIVWRNMNTGAVRISLMDGGTVTSWLNVGASPIALSVKLEAVGDFDGNGRADMLWRNQGTGRSVMSYHNADGSVSQWPLVSNFIALNTSALKVGDINGDGKDDIVWRNMSTGNVVISLMDGNVATWRGITSSPIALSVALEAVGDFDNNGRADLLWRNTRTGNSLMSYHNEDGGVASWPVVSNYINPTSTSAQGVGDFDGDGKDDILWRNLSSGNTVISIMNGNVPSWQSVKLY